MSENENSEYINKMIFNLNKHLLKVIRKFIKKESRYNKLQHHEILGIQIESMAFVLSAILGSFSHNMFSNDSSTKNIEEILNIFKKSVLKRIEDQKGYIEDFIKNNSP